MPKTSTSFENTCQTSKNKICERKPAKISASDNKSPPCSQEAILTACVYKKHCNTNSGSNRVNRPKTVLFLNFNPTDIWIFCFIH